MEFKKIGDRKFQCRLNAEDLEDNNISLDDFFNNDAEKIHDLLEIIMEEAQKNKKKWLTGYGVTFVIAILFKILSEVVKAQKTDISELIFYNILYFYKRVFEISTFNEVQRV